MTQPSSQQDRFAFAANLQSRDGGVSKDARIHNGFVELVGSNISIWQRPVLGSGAVGSGGGQGLITYGTALYSIAGGTLFANGPTFSGITQNTDTSVSIGFVAPFQGYIYNIDFLSGNVFKANPTGSLRWQLVSTNGFKSGLTQFGVWEVGTLLWASINSGAGAQAVRSPDGITWDGTNLGLLPSVHHRVVGFKGTAFYYNETFTNGEAISYPVITATSTTLAQGTVVMTTGQGFIASAFGTGGGYLWVLGGTLVARSSDGINFNIIGTGVTPGGAGVHIHRMAYVANQLIAPMGEFGTGAIIAIQSSAPWSTSGTYGSSLANSQYQAILAGNSSYILGGNFGTGTTGYMKWANLTFGTNLGTLAAAFTVDPGIKPSGFLSSGTRGLLVMQGTQGMYVFDPLAGTGSKVTGGSFPNSMVPGLVYLDQTYYVMDINGVIWNSDPGVNDPTTWPALGFITAEFEPDSGVALSKALNRVVAFGQWSTQFFWDAGNSTGSPLNPVTNGVILVGCASAGSVVKTESTIVFMGQRKGDGGTFQKGRFIAILVGDSYQELSTPSVNRILDVDDLSNVYASIVELGGHSWYILGLENTGITLVYDLKQKLWYTWSRLTPGTPINVTKLSQINGLAMGTTGGHGFSDGDPIVISGASSGYNGTVNVNTPSSDTFTYPMSGTGTSTSTGTILATPWAESYLDIVSVTGLGNVQLVQDSDGSIYTISLGSYIDLNGVSPINLKLRTNNLDSGNNERKFCFSMAVIGDILLGTDASTGQPAYGMLRYSDDDQNTWAYYRRFDLSSTRPNQQRWGNYRRRAWEWRFTGTGQHRLQYLEPDIKQGVT